jgi:hypothetical protein
MLLGFACGVVVLIQVIMGAVPFYALIWSNDPVVTTLTCIVKTTVAGLVAGIAYDIIAKKNSIVVKIEEFLHNLFNNDQYDTCIIPRGDGLSLSIKK